MPVLLVISDTCELDPTTSGVQPHRLYEPTSYMTSWYSLCASYVTYPPALLRREVKTAYPRPLSSGLAQPLAVQCHFPFVPSATLADTFFRPIGDVGRVRSLANPCAVGAPPPPRWCSVGLRRTGLCYQCKSASSPCPSTLKKQFGSVAPGASWPVPVIRHTSFGGWSAAAGLRLFFRAPYEVLKQRALGMVDVVDPRGFSGYIG